MTRINYQENDILVGFGRSGHLQLRAGGYGKFGPDNSFDGPVPVQAVADRLFGWDAVEASLTMSLPDGRDIPVSGRKAVAHGKTGELFGVFSPGYAIHQYREWLLDNVATILDADLGIASAGLAMGGGVAWVNVSMPDTITTPEGVEFFPYLTAYTSHNGKYATGYRLGRHNMVCANEMGSMHRGVGGGAKLTIKHTSRSGLRVLEAREVLGIIHGSGDEFASQVKALCELEVTASQWDAFVAAHVPIAPDAKPGRGVTMAQDKRERLRWLYTRDHMVAPWAGTAYGVVQAVNTYTHHWANVRGVARQERNLLGTLDGAFDALDAGTLDTLNRVLATV